ncbi:NAD-dependent epimerase/dehydratase family protein [bacterium]|nr:NAD-dependent epimerase/dehydratase family protein [bacterium]
MNVLITGATGFIGRHAAMTLLPERNISVRLLLLESELGHAGDFPGADIVPGDMTDAGVLARAVDGCDAVIHLAAKNIDRDGTGFTAVNVTATETLCRAAVSAGVSTFIYLSSVGVYGHHRHTNADETAPVRPDSDFSRSKAAAEKIVLEHHLRGDFTAVILRHRFVYGPGDLHVIPRMVKAARSYPFLISGGRAHISLILVTELAAVFLAFLRGGGDRDEHPVYHVTDGHPLRYRDLIFRICDEYGYKRPRISIPFRLLYLPVRLKELLLGIDPEATPSSISSMRLKLVALDNSFSNEKLLKRFPGLSFTPFEEAFGELVEYYREQ